ncbi:MAG: hypothetical protein JWL61_5103, partial [Gemmatimonadetes bacterium]|nr:hypothetical protein [Gemmatimonadota bacterium]
MSRYGLTAAGSGCNLTRMRPNESIGPVLTGSMRAHPALVRSFVVVTALLLSLPAPAVAQTSIISRRANRIADSVLALMTIDEKLGQLTQLPAGSDQTGPTVDAG